MATKKYVVTGDQYQMVDRRMREIKRQLDQEGGSPLNPIWVAKVLQDLVESRTEVHTFFPVWKTVRLGTGLKTADDFRQASTIAGCKISKGAENIISKPAFVVANEEIEIDLVVLSVAELGFENGAVCRDIYECAQELDLLFCPAEVGPQLRLQYKDQSIDEWLLVMMEPITGYDNIPDVFCVGLVGDSLLLVVRHASPDTFYRGGCRWVFALRE